MTREEAAQVPGPAEVPEEKLGPARGDASDAFRLRGEPPRVMRLSRKALATLGITAGLGIGGSLIYALQPHRALTAANLYDTDGRNKADVVTAAPGDYAKVPKLGPPLPGDLGRPILGAQADGKAVPVPPMGAATNPQADAAPTAAEQARARQTQERDAARASRLFLGADGQTRSDGPGNGPAGSTPQAGGAASSVTSGADAPTPQAQPVGQGAKRAFLQNGGNRITESAERLTSPSSPDVLLAGSVIPAALITGIRSDLPGQITAQVTQNVYDSPTGRILLIPQGARLIGEYDSDVSGGQNRVLLAWDRLILPDGRSILLDRQPGADARGFAGLQDGTNYHWGNMLKAALVSTLLGLGSEMATDNGDELMRALRYGSQDTINQTGRQLVQREANVPPTLTIRPGYPLRVMVTRDLVLAPLSGGQ
ncbi:TrbI/VirB10 family protein [Sphingomonas sp. OTU376]|uniref:TrbI/VirB10 family protein n=1 Tax=Sphingomonas sp. OTU376 TaxID=3043863 RepID=UPI00313B2C3D